MKVHWVTTSWDAMGEGDIVDTGKRFWFVASIYRCFGGVYATLKDAKGDIRKELFSYGQLTRTRRVSQ